MRRASSSFMDWPVSIAVELATALTMRATVGLCNPFRPVLDLVFIKVPSDSVTCTSLILLHFSPGQVYAYVHGFAVMQHREHGRSFMGRLSSERRARSARYGIERKRCFDVVHSSLYLYRTNDGCLWISGISPARPFFMRRCGEFEASISMPARLGGKLHNSPALHV